MELGSLAQPGATAKSLEEFGLHGHEEIEVSVL
jgi:hypothetical protein